MSGLNSIAIDLDAEETGVWTTVLGMDFLVARAGNAEWKKRNKKLERQAYGNKLRNPNFERDADKDVEIMVNCLAYTAILDWKENVTLDDKPIPFSSEKAFEILSNKRFRKLTEGLLNVAMNEDLYLEEAIAEDEKK